MNTRQALLAFVAAGVAPALSLGQSVRYTVTDLGRLPNSSSAAPRVINNNGVVVGDCGGPQTQSRGFIWTRQGGMIQIQTPASLPWNRVSDINDAGVISGWMAQDFSAPGVAYRYSGGVFTTLPPIVPYCEDIQLRAINSSAVGAGMGCRDAGGQLLRAFVHAPGVGYTELPSPIGTAIDINDLGQVTGGAIGGVYIWDPQGGTQVLGTFPPSSLYSSFQPVALNNHGEIAGTSRGCGISQDCSVAWRYSPLTGFQVIAQIDNQNVAYGMNNRGEVVGSSGLAHSGNFDGWLWSPQEGLVLLTERIDGMPDFTIKMAYAINDRGEILADAQQMVWPFTGMAVVLTPISSCYANCDGSAGTPVLNVNDFVCFQSRFAAAEPYADCDHSGALNVNDFICFQQSFAAGCR